VPLNLIDGVKAIHLKRQPMHRPALRIAIFSDFGPHSLNYFVRGLRAWLTFRPSSRPRRMPRRFMIAAALLLAHLQRLRLWIGDVARLKTIKEYRKIFVRRPAIRVSIVVSTLNRAQSLARNLESLRRQTYREFEVIVVNGPSTDNTEALLRDYNGNIRLGYCPDQNLGRSRNIGLEMAAGDIVAFTDDDAVPAENWIERLAFAYRRSSVAGAGGWVFSLPLSHMEWRNCMCTRAGDISANSDVWSPDFTAPGADPFLYLAGCNMSFRRSVLAEIGPFNEKYRYGFEDIQISRRLIDAGYMIVQLGESAVVYHAPEPNCWRDTEGGIRDPYFPLRARAIFALEGVSETKPRERALARLMEVAQIWRDVSKDRVTHGTRTAAEHETFLRRVDDALQDGIAASQQDCAPRTLKFPPASSFLRYFPY